MFQFVLYILNEWELTVDQVLVLLGDMPKSTYYSYKKNVATKELKLSRDVLDRLSYLVLISNSLYALYPNNKEIRDSWIKRPNQAFGGESPLNVMLKGSMIDLVKVHKYLDYLVHE